ncbi:MAG: alpha-galactosidase [Lachnospiraceae bacterium]|nr:alpha-galactosidase [Lachnospiraceae bacterium]
MLRLSYLIDGQKYTVSESDKNLTVTNEKTAGHRVITVTALADLVLGKAEYFLKYDYAEAERILANGYQSWTETKETAPGETLNDLSKVPKKLEEKYRFKAYGSQAFFAHRKNTPVGFDFGYVTGSNPLFFGNLNYKNAYLLIWFDKDQNRILLESDISGRELKAGESFTVFDYTVARNGREYFNRFTPRTDRKLFGYTSWYNHYQNISEGLILNALAGADERFDLFQIDDGFEAYVGDWMDIDSEKFPNGLGEIVEQIHGKGMKAGIWLAPLVAETDSKLFKEHPDWFPKDSDGNYIYAGGNWSGFYPLDLNKAETVDYIREVLRFYKELGFDFFKLDFLYAVNLCPLKGKTRSETAEFAYGLLREELSDRLILGCGATLSNGFERFDYCRIGPDVSLKFDDSAYMRLFHPERVSTKVTLQNTIFRSGLDGHAFLNDPDVFLLRDDNIHMTFAQRKALTKMNALFGSLLMISDQVSEYDEEKKEVLEDALAIFKRARRIGFRNKGRYAVAEFELDGEKRFFAYDYRRGVLAEKTKPGPNEIASDKSAVIFGNRIDAVTLRKAERKKQKYLKKYGDDSGKTYHFAAEDVPALSNIGIKKLVLSDEPAELADNPLVVGNIRMGFGHYRISIAMASCARALGYTPYWLDLAGLDATGSKMIREQNDLYSTASRISQKSRLFNRFVWEPLNKEGFRKITYNAADQKNAELLTPLFKALPKDVPYIATHVWPSQAAIHAGMTHVVNAIPDNWPMALHLSEGAIHTVQTPFAYLGYKMLHGFSKDNLRGIPEKEIRMVGRYVDHELLVNLEEDNALRIQRAQEGAPMRFLMTVGGAGAGFAQFKAMLTHLLPYVKEGKAAVLINFGDHEDVYQKIAELLSDVSVHEFRNDYNGLTKYVKELRQKPADGVTIICDSDIFKAVYATNLLMPECDVLITKPSELAYYPIPKMFMKHIGGHEVYGAICSQEAGDGTFECDTDAAANDMIDRFLTDKELFIHICRRINQMKQNGDYDGAYECVRLAAETEM